MNITTGTGSPIDNGDWNNLKSGTDLFTNSFIEMFKVTALDSTAGAHPVTYQFELRPQHKVP